MDRTGCLRSTTPVYYPNFPGASYTSPEIGSGCRIDGVPIAFPYAPMTSVPMRDSAGSFADVSQDVESPWN